MLQTRVGKRTPQAALRMAVEMADDPSFPLTREEAVRRVAPLLVDPPATVGPRPEPGPALTTGLGASPGVVAGEICLTPDAAIAAADRGADVILVRAETSPDDVHGMGRSRGILTATGGFASHAAVVARGWGIPAVVAASDVVIGDGSLTIGGRTLAPGDVITIDGTTGEVFAGTATGESRPVSEVAVLLEWAHELGLAIGGPGNNGEPGSQAPAAGSTTPAAADPTPVPAASGGELTAAAALRVLIVKGYAGPDAIATAAGGVPAEAAIVVERLVADGLAEVAVGSFRLTAAGREAAAALVADDTAAWGVDLAVAALDAFLALDHRMKDTVTAWQTREVGGVQGLNDHADPTYDRAVLNRLAALHADATAWLDGLEGAPKRMRTYAARLAAAAAQADAGDGRYVASPRVDSYHGAWFELHEDLILLAGRTRADEVTAGRA
ncbi:MAG: PEP-utilizing enzyme, partial [Candidatus Limnocylindrales bacterium]